MRGEPTQHHNDGAEAPQGSTSLAPCVLIASRIYPQGLLELPELIVQQDPQHKVIPWFQYSHGRLGTWTSPSDLWEFPWPTHQFLYDQALQLLGVPYPRQSGTWYQYAWIDRGTKDSPTTESHSGYHIVSQSYLAHAQTTHWRSFTTKLIHNRPYSLQCIRPLWCSKPLISASFSSMISKQIQVWSSIPTWSYNPPHCHPNRHQYIHGVMLPSV